jgi:hypothetical protein
MQALLCKDHHYYVAYNVLSWQTIHTPVAINTANAQCRSGWPPHVIRIKTRILRNAGSNGSL